MRTGPGARVSVRVAGRQLPVRFVAVRGAAPGMIDATSVGACVSLEVSDVRRRVRAAIEAARAAAQERRVRVDQAARDYEELLRDRAVPVFHVFAAALVAEGRRFKVFTPAGAVRLAADVSGEDFIELSLDTSMDPPAVVGRVSRGRGRRSVTSERLVSDQKPIAQLTEEDVLSFLVSEIAPLLER